MRRHVLARPSRRRRRGSSSSTCPAFLAARPQARESGASLTTGRARCEQCLAGRVVRALRCVCRCVRSCFVVGARRTARRAWRAPPRGEGGPRRGRAPPYRISLIPFGDYISCPHENGVRGGARGRVSTRGLGRVRQPRDWFRKGASIRCGHTRCPLVIRNGGFITTAVDTLL